MPLYEYLCAKCGNKFETIEKFSDVAQTVHSGCGGAVERLISAPALQFKGSGWYVNDYAKSGSKGAKESQEHKDSKSGEAKSSDTKSSDTKSSDTKSSDTKSSETKSSDSSSSSSSSPATSPPPSSSSSGSGSGSSASSGSDTKKS